MARAEVGRWRIVSTVSLNLENIVAAEENCEHRLVNPGRNRWRIVSTVSLNRYDIAAA